MQSSFEGVVPQSENDRLISAIGYVITPIVPIIALITTLKESRFNRIHAYQGLIFFGIEIAYFFLFSCVYFVLTSVAGLLACILWIGYFLPYAAAFYLAYRVYSAGQIEFPYLSQATRSVFKDI